MAKAAVLVVLSLAAATLVGLGSRPSDATVLTSTSGSPGTIATVAGGGNGDGGPARAAALARGGTAVDGAGDLYIGDYDRVRKVTGGTITTFAGGGPCC